MMVNMQQNLMQFNDKFMEQQKIMYEQRKEIDMLKESNNDLMQKINDQQMCIENLEQKITARGDGTPGKPTIAPSFAQVLGTGSRQQVEEKIGNDIPLTEERDSDDSIDAQERADRAKRMHNIAISGISEGEEENARVLKTRVQEVLSQHFDMSEVPIEGAHRVGKVSGDTDRPRIIICTVMDVRKRQIILENSSTYLKGTHVYINEDRTLMQQKEVRERVAERKAKLEKRKSKSDAENEHK